MLKVQMVYSNMDYTKSLINDESDERSNTFYCKQLLVDVDEDHDISCAYRMDNKDFPFGYEFVRKATLREINFGESDMTGEKLSVSGVEEVRNGFRICKYCGKIQFENGKANHSYACKTRKMPALMQNDAYEECLFLYREFSTEILRLLVPATTMDSSSVKMESFVAAFMLGMKEYFGNVDHLRATVSEAPVPDADYRKQYLVIYDSVPGGTGYLKQLMHEKNALIEIFEKALHVMENCSCKDDPQKDGCYHCLYAYRQSQQIGHISRTTAIRILKSILSGKDNVDFVFPGTIFGSWIPRSSNAHLTIYSAILASELKAEGIVSVCAVLNDEKDHRTDKYEQEWNGLWRFYNLMQFSDEFIAVSSVGMSHMDYFTLPVAVNTDSDTAAPVTAVDDAWNAIEELLFDDDAKAFGIKMRRTAKNSGDYLYR